MQCLNCKRTISAGAKFCSHCGVAQGNLSAGRHVSLRPGQVMNKRYTIQRRLGKGGMGAVYLATEIIANRQRQVVIKEMLNYFDPADLQGEAKARQRFELEAATLVTLNFAGIPQIFAYFSEHGRNYIVMQFIKGNDLEKGLTHKDDQGNLIPGKPYSSDQVLRWGVQVCKALENLAAKNVVHMDIKPANLIADHSGDVWLVDFGTAKAQWEVQPDGSVGMQKSSVYGTIGYAPPEQYTKQTELRSDVYALAATLYHLLTDDDPQEHPFSFPRLGHLPTDIASALQPALEPDVNLRIRAAVFKDALLLALSPPPPPGNARKTLVVAAAIAGLIMLILIGVGIAIIMPGIFGTPTPVVLTAASASVSETQTTVPTSQPVDTDTPFFDPTQTSFPPTYEPVHTSTFTPTQQPTFTSWSTSTPANSISGIGSTQISPADGMVMVYVPEGDFIMGAYDGYADEQPPHTVYLDAYWIDRTEVTNAMYEKCVDAGACNRPAYTDSYTRDFYYGHSAYNNFPVMDVSWHDAQAYCAWTGRRLPTEAEWEKAARGDDERTYPWGNAAPAANLLNWNNMIGDTAAVGSYPAGASPYGALDMAGNLWEWVADWYSDSYYANSPTKNPLGPSDGDYRVLRGGSCIRGSGGSLFVRTTNRWYDHDNSVNKFGFRCASSASP